MKNLITVLLYFSTVLLSLAVDNTETTKALLTKQAADWDAAICNKDKAAIEANMGEGFRHIDPYGDLSDAATFLSDIISPDLTIDPYTVENQDVRIYGDIALLSGTTRMTGAYKGTSFKSHYRYVDIYNLQKGRWVVINIQVTRFRE